MDFWRNEWAAVTDVSEVTGVDDVLQKASRPKWEDVYAGYPKNADGTDDLPAPQVFKKVFGDLYNENTQKISIGNGNYTLLENVCATRISMALINAKYYFKKGNYNGQVGLYQGKKIITQVRYLKDTLLSAPGFGMPDVVIKTSQSPYLNKNGKITLSDVRAKIGNRNGIYIIIPHPGSFRAGIGGHATLWVATKNDVIGSHHYVNCIGELYFWELQ